MKFSSTDLALAARVEAADANNLAALARTALADGVAGAAFESFAGGVAVFAGVGSALTHAMGVGFSGHVPEAELERMEAFFRERGSPCLIDLCPLADPSVVAFVQSRPYRAVEFNNLLVRKIEPDERFDAIRGVRLIGEAEYPRWAEIVTRGFSEFMPVDEGQTGVMTALCKGSFCWLAGESEPVGGAAMGIQNDVALFYGDSTITTARGKGWQTALIRARLAEAQRRGCALAIATVLPGSGSHRNYERAGFQLIYMRVNLSREFPAGA